MFEFLSGRSPIIFENTDVLQAGILLQILDTLSDEQKKLLDLRRACVPQLPVVTRIFQQNFVRANRSHTVVNAIAASRSFTFHPVKRGWMHDGTRRPRRTWCRRQTGDDLTRRRRISAEGTLGLRMWCGFGNIVAGNYPGTGNGIFAKLHGCRKTLRRGGVNSVLRIREGPMETTDSSWRNTLRASAPPGLSSW